MFVLLLYQESCIYTFVVYMCCCHSFLHKKQDGSYMSTSLSKPCHTCAVCTTDFPGGVANNLGAQQRVTTSLRMTDLYCTNEVTGSILSTLNTLILIVVTMAFVSSDDNLSITTPGTYVFHPAINEVVVSF